MGNSADDILSSFGLTNDAKTTTTCLWRNSTFVLRREMSYLNALGSTNASKRKENKSTTS